MRHWTLLLAAALHVGCSSGPSFDPAGVIYFTTDGAQSLAPYEMDRTAAAVEAVLEEFGVRGIERRAEAEGAVRTFRGLDEESRLEVSVRLERRAASSTQLEAAARRGPVLADQSYARRLVRRILEVARQG